MLSPTKLSPQPPQAPAGAAVAPRPRPARPLLVVPAAAKHQQQQPGHHHHHHQQQPEAADVPDTITSPAHAALTPLNGPQFLDGKQQRDQQHWRRAEHSPKLQQPQPTARRAAAPAPGSGPPPDAFTGPPRVPAVDDAPLPLAWVEALPEAQTDGVGSIHVVMGPMFAGKSTALLDMVAAQEAAGRRVAVVKSAVDDRYARAWVVTHNGRRARCFTAPTLSAFAEQMGPLLGRFHAVAVDEAQFFPDLLDFSLSQAEGAGRDVLVAGLSCDFMRRSFGDLVHLVPHAASVQRLTAQCFYCSAPAAYTVRVVGKAGQQLVGGADMYRPACTPCYHACNGGRVVGGADAAGNGGKAAAGGTVEPETTEC